MKIGISILCTNGYFPLGVRLVKRFNHFYKGENEIRFILFTDTNPADYLPNYINYEWRELRNKNWVEGTNSKFTSILSLENSDLDYIFYLDADTNVDKDFGDWFIGDLVAGQHYADESYMLNDKAYERNPQSMAYIPKDTKLPQMYYYGAFWGGTKGRIMEFCRTMIEWQKKDKEWGFEPVWNDESYLQRYMHYNPPTKVVLCKDFPFLVSDKGGMGETRNMNLDIEHLLIDLREHKEKLIDIKHGKVCV